MLNDKKDVLWFKAELYGTPLITYLVAADSYEAVKKSFGCLIERYKISPLEFAGMKEFFNDDVKVVAVRVAQGSSDIVFIKDGEICVLRVIL